MRLYDLLTLVGKNHRKAKSDKNKVGNKRKYIRVIYKDELLLRAPHRDNEGCCQGKTLRLPLDCARTRCKLKKENYGGSREGVSGGRSATLKDGRGKSCAQFVRIRTGQGYLSPPGKGHAECRRRQHEAKAAQKKHPP